MAPAPIHVVAGALVDKAGRVLIAERPPGKAQAGRWEFPGGKRHERESPREALARELMEEIGVELGAAAPLLAITHHYAGAPAPVLIDCWRVESWRGEVKPLDGQRLRWCTLPELAAADILEADRSIVTALLLPRIFVRLEPGATAAALQRTSARGERVGWLIDAGLTDPDLLARLAADGAQVFLIDPVAPAAPAERAIYTRTEAFRPSTARLAPAGRLVASATEAHAAREAGADFLLVGERELPSGTLAEVAATGLPWYLNVVRPAAAGEPLPTGQLWWRPGGAR